MRTIIAQAVAGEAHGVRPFAREASLCRRVLRVTPLSAGLKVELQAEGFGTSVRADIDWERGAALGLRGGEDVFVSLRRARVFNENRDRIAA